MAKVIDITDKLNFEENPRIMIKGKEYEVQSDAPTMLKILQLMSKENITNSEVLGAYELLFPAATRKELDKLKLKFDDLLTVIESAMDIVTGKSDTQ